MRRCRWRISGWARPTIGWASRASAVDAYRAAIALAVPSPDPYKIRAPQHRAPPPGAGCQACRGVSAVARRLAPARAQRHRRRPPPRSTSSLALERIDPVAHYRYGRVQQARKDDGDGARRSSSTPSAARARVPPPILGNAYLEAARVLERLGRRAAGDLLLPHRDDALRRRRRHARRGDARAHATRAAVTSSRRVGVDRSRDQRSRESSSRRSVRDRIDRTTVIDRCRSRQIWCAFF